MQDDGPSTSHIIDRLPISTQSRLRSTQILTSLPQLISELVQNALDAGASQVDVGVDCEEWECWVKDNGIGFGRDDLDAIAGASDNLSRRYRKSRV